MPTTPYDGHMRAAIYARISADPTGRGLGVGRQIEDCEKLCTDEGWTVVQRYADNDVSAFSGKLRPQYEAMLAAVESGGIDVLVAYHADRLHRSPIELERFIGVVERAQCDVRTISGGVLDLSSSAGRMLARLLGAVARQESEHASERRRRANDQRAAAGVWHTSKRPFGYTMDGRPLEPEASAIKAACEDVLAGKSMRQIAREWNAAGLRTSQTGSEFSSPTLGSVLKNPRYAALRVHRGDVVGPGAWEPIITPEQHRAVVAFLTAPSRLTNTARARKWVGSGVYRCGVCGARLVTHTASGGSRAYKCPSAHVRRQAVALDELVEDAIVDRLSRTGFSMPVAEGPDLGALQAQRDGVRDRMNVLADLLGRGDMDAEQFSRASTQLRGQLDDVDEQIADASRSGPLAALTLAGEDVRGYWGSLSPEMRGDVVDMLLEVRVMPSPRGLRRFDPNTIEMTWIA